MNKQDIQKIGAGLIRVTGQDKRGDVYFTGAKNVSGVIRRTGPGKYIVLAGFRRTDGYWQRKGCDYTYHKYPVYEHAVTCSVKTLRQAMQDAVVSCQRGVK